MALGGVFMTDTDGNIGIDVNVNNENISGLLFDVSGTTSFPAALKGSVFELNYASEWNDLLKENSVTTAVMNGIPEYHINQYFSRCGEPARLFVAFADCSNNFNEVANMQHATRGIISQIGIWTPQALFGQEVESTGTYRIATINSTSIIAHLEDIAETLAKENAPLSLILSANTSGTSSTNATGGTISSKEIVLSKLPDLKTLDSRYVSVILGQDSTESIHTMQAANSDTPVGVIGLALGSIASANVANSIGWVQENNLVNYVGDIEFGFGDLSKDGGNYKSTLKYTSLTRTELDSVDTKGYIFLINYAGLESGVYFNDQYTCDNGDYRTIARNRTINKSRRIVRQSLLPYVNSPLKVDPSTGYLSSAQITVFNNLVSNGLQKMYDNNEISGFAVTIPETQNVLKNDKLLINYKLVPVGTAKFIEVTEGLALTTN